MRVAIVAPGNMGAAVARRLSDNGVEVVTTLDNRGPESQARAAAASMRPVSPQQLTDSDFILSIVPPGVAIEFAQTMAPLLRSAPRKPVFVDCNAVSPDTAQHIASIIEPTGAEFVDAGIIGPPPRAHSGIDAASGIDASQPTRAGTEPSIYASGPAAPKFAVLRELGLDVRVLDGPIGAASALKMCYAGIQKGVTAIATAMTLAAARVGASAELKRELATREPQYFAALSRKVPDMLPKAYRWVAEMREISQFAEPDGAGAIYSGAAKVYERVAKALADGGTEVETLRAFFRSL